MAIKWHTTWDPAEMAACVSPQTTVGMAGLTVSRTIFLFVMEAGEEAKAILDKSGVRTDKRFVAYWEHAAVFADGEPFFWNARFPWLTNLAQHSTRVWWTSFERFPSADECFPNGVSRKDVYVMDNDY